MKRLTMSCSLLVVLVCAAGAMAGPPVPIDRPTPPPCAADGICYPNTGEWGFYPGRWRRWPGHELMPTPVEPTPAERLGPDLSPYETPTPEKEDEQAPPASTKKPAPESTVEPGAAAPESDGTDAPMTPSYEPSPLTPPAEPTTDLDPPPTPPFAMSSAIRSQAAASRVPTDPRPGAARPASASDPPPTLPWTYHSASL